MSRRRNGLYLNVSRAGVKLDQREMGWLHLQSGRATISLPPSPWRENNKSVNGKKKKESALSNLARAPLILLAWNTGGKNCGLDRGRGPCHAVRRSSSLPPPPPPPARKHEACGGGHRSLPTSLDGIDRDKRDEAKEEKEREEGRGEWA